jgi:hypothetical protein
MFGASKLVLFHIIFLVRRALLSASLFLSLRSNVLVARRKGIFDRIDKQRTKQQLSL